MTTIYGIVLLCYIADSDGIISVVNGQLIRDLT